MGFFSRNSKFLFFFLLLVVSQSGVVASLDALYNDTVESIVGLISASGFSGASVLLIRQLLNMMD
jgi:hypothetical protein